MRRRVGESVVRIGLVVSVVLLLVAGVPDPARPSTPVAYASPGSLLSTVSLAAASCTAAGSSMAVVSGRMVGVLDIPSLLVVSCQSPQPTVSSTLHFITPATGAVVKSLATS